MTPEEELAALEQKRADVEAAFRAHDLARFHVANVASWLMSALDFLASAEQEQDPDERRIKLKVARAEVERERARMREKLASVDAADRALSLALDGSAVRS